MSKHACHPIILPVCNVNVLKRTHLPSLPCFLHPNQFQRRKPISLQSICNFANDTYEAHTVKYVNSSKRLCRPTSSESISVITMTNFFILPSFSQSAYMIETNEFGCDKFSMVIRNYMVHVRFTLALGKYIFHVV